MENLHCLPASQLALTIRNGRVSSSEAVKSYLEQIRAHNPRVNAVVTLDEEGALERALQADQALSRGELWGPLHGVPVTFKDVFETAGLRTTSGSPTLTKYVPTQDATVVQRVRAAGAIILGKTNTPEFANDEQTANRLFGRTNNPWNLERTPGGSSGGSAAAIAAGFSALDIGSDIGGSVRNPAAFCGVYSLKPTDSLVPFQGHIPPPPGIRGRGLLRQFLCPGPLARSVADLRLALKIIAGPLAAQWEVPPVTLEEPLKKPLGGLKIAWCDDFGFPLSREIRSALAGLAGRLEQAGCRVQKCCPPDFDFHHAVECYGLIKEAAFTVRGTPLNLPRFAWKTISRFIPRDNSIARGLMAGAGAGITDLGVAMSRRDALIEKMEAFLSEWDAWICPTAMCPAYPHVPSDNLFKQLSAAVEVNGEKLPYILATSVYTSIFNLTGHPVVVIPAGRTTDGLPIGLQIVGQRWGDMELLNTTEAVSEATGAFQSPPGF